MDVVSLYGEIYPEMREILRCPGEAVGRAVVTGMGKADDGRHLAVVVMVIATDEPLTGEGTLTREGTKGGEDCGIQSYAARWIPDMASKRPEPELIGAGISGSLKNPIWQTD